MSDGSEQSHPIAVPDKPALEALKGELRDRFGPLPPAAETLLQVAELKLLAAEKGVNVIEVKEDKLMLTRQGDFITLSGKFPRLTKKQIPARLKEILAGIGQARIGTVHSVCGGLLARFAFELGLSPDLRVVEPNLPQVKVQRTDLVPHPAQCGRDMHAGR